MTPLGRPPVLLDIVEEHFDELDFLWEHREANLFTRDWDLTDLAEHEERAEAHLDGLRLAELHAIDFARERITSGETFATAAAALVLAESGEDEHEDLILASLAECERETADGVRFALRHFASDRLLAALQDLAAGEASLAALVASDVLTFRRLPAGSLERFAAAEDDAWARTIVLGCLGRTGALQEQHLVAAHENSEPAVRRVALREAARAGLPQLAAHLRSAVSRPTDPDPEALALLGVLGDPADLPLIEGSLARPELGPWAVSALGAMGRVQSIPSLIELMGDEELGVTATQAYQRITGADDVEGEKPFPPPPVAEGDDEQEELPPDPVKAKADWARREASMDSDHAWQWGYRIEADRLPQAFHALRLQSRQDVYLALRSRAQIADLELEALALRQVGR